MQFNQCCYYEVDRYIAPSIFLIILTIFKGTFNFWFFNGTGFYYSKNFFDHITLFYLIYFSFSILYYGTILLFLKFKEGKVNYIWFFVFGIIYIISHIILFFITNGKAYVEELITYMIEVIFLLLV
jgi:hypothetical protein